MTGSVVNLEYQLTAFLALFFILDAFGNVPIFASLLKGVDPKTAGVLIRKACLVALIVLLVFGAVGTYIFLLFGFSLDAFRIAGGILLFVLAFEMVHGQRRRSKLTDEEIKHLMEEEELSVTPLGTPLLAGPGAISTIMIYAAPAQAGSVEDALLVLVMAALAVAVSYPIVAFAPQLMKRLGKVGAAAIPKIMGLMLAAIAVQFMVNGVIGVYCSLPTVSGC
ncbi:MAG TPA: MarC family protein [Thermoplasmata archaeon]|nr:MarC family protein [Thermoplasmata archaeon]